MFRRKVQREQMDLKAVFENAVWPKAYNVTFTMLGGDPIRVNNVPSGDLQNLRKIMSTCEGGLLTLGDNGREISIPTNAISYYVAEEITVTMWTEDNL